MRPTALLLCSHPSPTSPLPPACSPLFCPPLSPVLSPLPLLLLQSKMWGGVVGVCHNQPLTQVLSVRHVLSHSIPQDPAVWVLVTQVLTFPCVTSAVLWLALLCIWFLKSFSNLVS